MQENINIPDSTITTNLSFRQLVLMNMQQLTNFPYIEKDFDALTDYELLSLVVKFLNDVIANQNEQNASITRMYQSFLALQDYVNNTKDTLEDAFNNLDDYVRNYFDNLDVQEEINNKLDQMLKDGVLEQIIEQFIQSTALWCFNTIADMKAATNLIKGSYAKTIGYYAINDGGCGEYIIVDDDSLVDDGGSIHALNNGLFAKLIINDTVNIKQFGAKCDLIHDDTVSIQNAINSTAKEIIIDSPSLVSVENEYNSAITMKSNKILNFKGNAYLQLDTNSFDGYEILNCENISNFKIYNCYLIGDKTAHTGVSGEWGHGLYINGCKDFYINEININDTWGDGVSFVKTDDSYYDNENGYINSINVYNASRNGVHIEQGKNLVINKIYCNGINRINPKSGIDFECDTVNRNFSDVIINDINIVNCPNGLNLQLDSHTSNTTNEFDTSIILENVFLENSGFNLYNFRNNKYSGYVKINNIIFNKLSKFIYFQIKNNVNVKYIIDNINILSQDTVSNTLTNDYSISIDSDNSALKELYLNNITINDNCLPRYSIKFLLQDDFTVENKLKVNIKTSKPLYLPPRVKGLDLTGSIIKLDLQDLYDTYNPNNLWGLNLFAGTHYTNKKATRNLICNFGIKFPIKNIPIILINENSSYSIGIENASGNNFLPSSENYNNKIVSAELGSELKFVYEESIDCYCIKNKIGNWSNS